MTSLLSFSHPRPALSLGTASPKLIFPNGWIEPLRCRSTRIRGSKHRRLYDCNRPSASAWRKTVAAFKPARSDIGRPRSLVFQELLYQRQARIEQAMGNPQSLTRIAVRRDKPKAPCRAMAASLGPSCL